MAKDETGPGAAPCTICGDSAPQHIHYGAISCYSCRAFFKRSQGKDFPKCLLGGNNCDINKFTRTNCKQCRYDRCTKMGMRMDKGEVLMKVKPDKSGKSEEQKSEIQTNPSRCKPISVISFAGKSHIQSQKKNMDEIESERDSQVSIEEKERKQNMLRENQKRILLYNHLNGIKRFSKMECKMDKNLETTFESNASLTKNRPTSSNLSRSSSELPTSLQPISSSHVCLSQRHNTRHLQTSSLQQSPASPPFPPLQQTTHFHQTASHPFPSTQQSSHFHQFASPPISSLQQITHFHQTASPHQIPTPQKNISNHVNPSLHETPSLHILSSAPQASSPIKILPNDENFSIHEMFASHTIPSSSQSFSLHQTPCSSQIISHHKTSSPNLIYFPNQTLSQNQTSSPHETTSTNQISTLYQTCLPHETTPQELTFSPHQTPQQASPRDLTSIFSTTLPLSSAQKCLSYSNTNISHSMTNHGYSNSYTRKHPIDSLNISVETYNSSEHQGTFDHFLKEEDEEQEDLKFEQEELPWVPIKKRRRLTNYSVFPEKRHIDMRIVPVMAFTSEETAKIGQIMLAQAKFVSLESNIAFRVINPEVIYRFENGRVEALAKGAKFVINENYLQFRHKLSKEAFKNEGCLLFDQFVVLPKSVRDVMFEATYPSTMILYFAFLHSRRNAKNLAQQETELLCSAETEGYRVQNIVDIVNTRTIRLDDFEALTSPWAVNVDDEIKFERVVATIGNISGGDYNISVLYFLMVISNPHKKSLLCGNMVDISSLVNVQGEINELMYRYLKAQEGYTEAIAARAVRSLKHLVSEVHECAHIFWKRRLQTTLDTTKSGDICIDESSCHVWSKQIHTLKE